MKTRPHFFSGGGRFMAGRKTPKEVGMWDGLRLPRDRSLAGDAKLLPSDSHRNGRASSTNPIPPRPSWRTTRYLRNSSAFSKWAGPGPKTGGKVGSPGAIESGGYMDCGSLAEVL